MPGMTGLWRPLERGKAAELRGVPWRRRLARSLALLFVVMGSLDVVSTNAGLAAGYVEGNPVMRLMQEQLGAWWAVPKAAGHFALASIWLWLPTRRLLVVAGVITVYYLAKVIHSFSLVVSPA